MFVDFIFTLLAFSPLYNSLLLLWLSFVLLLLFLLPQSRSLLIYVCILTIFMANNKPNTRETKTKTCNNSGVLQLQCAWARWRRSSSREAAAKHRGTTVGGKRRKCSRRIAHAKKWFLPFIVVVVVAVCYMLRAVCVCIRRGSGRVKDSQSFKVAPKGNSFECLLFVVFCLFRLLLLFLCVFFIAFAFVWHSQI